MEGEHIAAGYVRLQEVRETGFNSGALVAEGQRTPDSRQRVRKSLTVLRSLSFKPSKSAALLLGFHDAERLTINVEKVVGFSKTRLHREFADGDTTTSSDVGFITRLHNPASIGQKLVDVLPSTRFRAIWHGLDYEIIAETVGPTHSDCLPFSASR